MITLRFHHHQAKTSAISVVSSAVKLFASAACALNMTAFYAATRYSTTTTASTDTLLLMPLPNLRDETNITSAVSAGKHAMM